jgi:hypothetical protein
MRQVENNRELARPLLAKVCGRAAVMVDLRDAAAFIEMHGDRTVHWLTAANAIEEADRDVRLIELATRLLENAPRGDGMLD